MERAHQIDDVLLLSGRMSSAWSGEPFSAREIADDGAEAQLRQALDWAPELLEVDEPGSPPEDPMAKVIAMAQWVAEQNREMGGG